MTLSIEEILAGAKRPEATVSLFMRGDLVAEYERLDAQLADASTEQPNLGERSPARVIAEQMAALHDEMEASRVDYKLRAMSSKAWSDHLAVKPDVPEATTPEFRDAWHGWLCQLVADTCYEPAMTAEQADALSDALSAPQWGELTDGAWNLNAERQNIPFSVAAFAHLQSTEAKPKRPTKSASRTQSS